MADTEKKVVLTVDTGNAEKTVKGLKEEIKTLQNTILNLDKGTEEYNDAVRQLQANQRALNEVMGLTRRDAVALEGSYDALTYRMAELKKEWKATNDEARRNELGIEINEINAQLKELDASTGNFQRNVGNYSQAAENAFANLKQEIKDARNELLNAEEGTEEYAKAMQRLADAQFQLRDMNEQSRYAVADFGEQLSNVTGIASGVVSGFSALQAAFVLCGAESENLQKTMVKLQAAMALVQGLQGLEGIIDRVKGLGKALKALSTGSWIGIILTAVAALGAMTIKLVQNRREIESGEKAIKDWNKASIEQAKSIAQEVVALKIWENIATDVTQSYKNRVIAAKELLSIIGEQVTQENVLNLMQGELSGKIDGVTEALVRQAIAQAALTQIEEKAGELLAKRIEIEQKKKELAKPNKGHWLPTGSRFEPVTESGNERENKRIKRQIENLEEERTQLLTDINAIWETAKQMVQEMMLESSSENPDKKELTKTISDLANKEIEEIERVYQYRMAVNATSEKGEKEKARVEAALKQELANKKIAILTKYKDEAIAIQEQEVADDLSGEIAKLQIENMKTAYDEKMRLRELDEKAVREQYNNLNFLSDLSYKEQMANLERESITKEEKSRKAYEIELAYQEEQKARLQEYHDWLMEDEEKNHEEIISVKQNLAESELEIANLKKDREIEIAREMVDAVIRELDQLDDAYDKQQRKLALDVPVQDSKKERGFFGTVFGMGALDDWKSEDERLANENDYYQKAYEAEQAFLASKKALQEEYLAAETDVEARLEIEREIANTEIEIQESKYAELQRLRDNDTANEQRKQEQMREITMAGMDALSSVLGSMADIYEANEESAKANAEKIKALRISAAIIDTISGAIGAYTMAAATIPPPAGIIVGAVQAAAVTAAGVANVAKIKNTKIGDSNGGGNIGAAVTPQSNTYQSELPFSYTRQVTGAKEYDELNKDTKVYVVESDITEAQNRRKVRVQESSF